MDKNVAMLVAAVIILIVGIGLFALTMTSKPAPEQFLPSIKDIAGEYTLKVTKAKSIEGVGAADVAIGEYYVKGKPYAKIVVARVPGKQGQAIATFVKGYSKAGTVSVSMGDTATVYKTGKLYAVAWSHGDYIFIVVATGKDKATAIANKIPSP